MYRQLFYLFMTYNLHYVRFVFHVKIQHFVTAKSGQDLDPDPHWSGSQDLDPPKDITVDLDPH
jgi:hypothetical protein